MVNNIIELEMCTIGDDKKCFSVKLTKRMFWYIVLIFVVSIVASGIYGLAIAPLTGLGLSYAAYQLAINMMVLSMMVPIVGLIIGIGFYGNWATLTQLNLSITPDFWISSVTVAAFWIGIVLQVFILIYIFWTLITKNMNGKQV